MGASSEPRYDAIGRSYAEYRRTDPRIAAQIDAALGDATLVLNAGAGTGSYEVGGRTYVAVEPSSVMLGQRPRGAGLPVQGTAENLPFRSGVFDAAMAILTVHHWPDPEAGLAELRRTTAGPIVVLTWDAERFASTFWLVREYLPEAALHELPVMTLSRVRAFFGRCRVEPVLVPHDCRDGFFAAYWRRPELYLDEHVRASISGIALLPRDVVARMVDELRADLESGAWMRRHRDLMGLDAYDHGYRLVIADD